MNRDMERHKEFSRRALILGAGKILVFGTLASRLAYLQIVEQKKFQTLSDKNRISLRLLPAGRGEIMDRFGVPLAVNRQDFRAFLVPEQSEDVAETLTRLGQLIPISEEEKSDIMAEIGRRRPFTPILAKENLTWDDMSKVELRLPDLPGVSMEEGQMRSYPLGTATAHIIGYIGRVSKAELTDDPVMEIPGFRIGKTGVEKKYDGTLRGEAGQIQAEVNVVGREIRELSHTEGKKGHRLTLTIDADLQMQCQEYLGREASSAAVVMDAHNGEVYALCSHPSFDPNLFSSGIPADMWEELLANPTNPLTNKVISGQYPPGSTFKMVTAMAGLESGAINASTHVFCPGYYMLGNTKFHCWNKQGHGSVDVVAALRESCDSFFYEVGKRTGIDKIAAMARRMGLGSKLDFDVPGEVGGLVPDQEWKQKRYKEKWQQGETIIAAIGQGYMLTTPLQLATMTARLANGGKAVKPVLVRSIEAEGNQIPDWPETGFNSQHLDLVKKGMAAVVNDPRGTGYGSHITEAPYSMAGKTGTSQVRRITLAQRDAGIKNESLPWKFRHHALFVGYGPVEAPKYVTAVIVEHGVGGAKAAAPIARDILLAVQKRDPRKIRTVDDTGEKKTP
ncbi:MAG: penicillin-binding protein 2 [Alphaproteobacteria bacterium]|nr:penicillin-binding protein 2 [Alphaproteobacteria bacterium]